MSRNRSYEYARLWLPVYDAVSVAVTRPVYLIEAADGFEGFVAEKNTTLMAVLNDLGRQGWRIDVQPERLRSPSPDLQLLIDATLDEADHALSPDAVAHAIGSTGDPATGVEVFDVYGMRRRTA